ncbi:hypothetical protein HDU99_009700, partial [Rhizoclosmatium hyalinum]
MARIHAINPVVSGSARKIWTGPTCVTTLLQEHALVGSTLFSVTCPLNCGVRFSTPTHLPKYADWHQKVADCSPSVVNKVKKYPVCHAS